MVQVKALLMRTFLLLLLLESAAPKGCFPTTDRPEYVVHRAVRGLFGLSPEQG